MELPRTSCAGPARETFSLNPHHFGACREGLTAGRGYHCAIRRLPWRWRTSVPVKPETLRTCTQADTLPKDCRRLRAQRCPCHWQNLQSTRKSSGRRCHFLGSGCPTAAVRAARRRISVGALVFPLSECVGSPHRRPRTIGDLVPDTQ